MLRQERERAKSCFFLLESTLCLARARVHKRRLYWLTLRQLAETTCVDSCSYGTTDVSVRVLLFLIGGM